MINGSLNKNYFDIENMFFDGGTGAIGQKKQENRKYIDQAFSVKVSPMNKMLPGTSNLNTFNSTLKAIKIQ